MSTATQDRSNGGIKATATVAGLRPTAIPTVNAGQAAAEAWQANFAEDAAEPPEPDYAFVAQALASVKDERLAFRPNLYVEMADAVLNLPSDGVGRAKLVALGVGIESIRAAGGLGAQRITTDGGYFSPAERGDSQAVGAIVLPVFDGELVDLIAFTLGKPAQFYVRNGYAKALGLWNADDVRGRTTLWPLPREIHPSLPLFPDPLSWLRSGCEGTCVLNSAWLAYTLVGIRAVTAISKHHRKVLCKRLSWPGAPKVFLRRQHEAVAA